MKELRFEYPRGGGKTTFDFQGIDIFSFYSMFSRYCRQRFLKCQVERTFSHPKVAKDRSNDPSKWCISLEVRYIWKPASIDRINSYQPGRESLKPDRGIYVSLLFTPIGSKECGSSSSETTKWWMGGDLS